MEEPSADERAVVESLLAGDEQYASTWRRLPNEQYLAAWRAVNVRAVGLLASLVLQRLAEAQAMAGRLDVDPWVHRAIDAARATELTADVLMQAWLAEYHDRGVRVAGENPDPDDPMAIGARLAVLGSQLMAGELDQDSVRVRQLMNASTGPDEVREALVQVADALTRDLAEATGGSHEQVLRALVAG